MTRDELLQVLNRHVDAYARHDPVGLAALHAEHSLVVSPMFATIRGRKAIEESYVSLFTAFPDLEMKGEPPIVDGNHVAQVFQASATHVNELFGLPGTRKRVEITVAYVLTFENGLIVEERRIYDFTRLLLQLGVLKGKLG